MACVNDVLSDVANVTSSSCCTQSQKLNLVTYNMHGFSQGYLTIRDLIQDVSPDIFLVQEHWLTPVNMSKFQFMFSDYLTFGSSAMSSSVETGILRGRPYGGVAIMINNRLRQYTRTICAAERYVIVKISNYLFVNWHLPCSGTSNRQLIIEEILAEVDTCIKYHNDCNLVLGGDFNCDLDSSDSVTNIISDFMKENNLHRCDSAAGSTKAFTYCSDALGHYSCIDFVLMSDVVNLCSYSVKECGSNLSDHLPVMVQFTCDVEQNRKGPGREAANGNKQQQCLRWDKADLGKYYSVTGELLQNLLVYYNDNISHVTDDRDSAVAFVNCVYSEIVNALHASAQRTVPTRPKNFYKFWWCQELDTLKENSMRDHRIWKDAGRPRSGPIFKAYQSDK